MKFSIRDWRPSHLFGAWVSYWVLLAGVTLWRPLSLLARLRGSDVHGTASAHFDDGILTAHVDVAQGPLWETSAHLGTIFGWIAGPPLVIWLVFMATRPSRTVMVAAPAPALDAGAPPALRADGEHEAIPSRRVAERERVK